MIRRTIVPVIAFTVLICAAQTSALAATEPKGEDIRLELRVGSGRGSVS